METVILDRVVRKVFCEEVMEQRNEWSREESPVHIPSDPGRLNRDYEGPEAKAGFV